jgi:molybdenum cofactor cytidylyltransferase
MIVGVLLAAGQSSRFGTDKLIQPLPDGTPMVCAAARNLRTGSDRVIAVVQPGLSALGKLLGRENVEIVECTDAASGMGHSIACAVRSSPDAAGWLVALGDMPFIEPTTHRTIADALRAGAAIAAPEYGGRRGHPVGFGNRFRGDLSILTGDTGARDILDRHRDLLQLIACDDPGILKDIDTPADLPGHPAHTGI